MTLVKLNKPRIPWYDSMFTDLLGTDRLLTNDIFVEDNWVPSMNVKEAEDKFELEIAAPGFSKKDFSVLIENGILNISAEHKEEKKEELEKFTRREFNYNSFKRSFTLPENVNHEETIDATYKHGILKLVLNKVHVDDVPQKRIIEVH